jgi:hypothetical protein
MKQKTYKKYTTATLLALVTFFIYSINTPSDYKIDLQNKRFRRLMPSTDTLPNAFIPYLLIKSQTLDFQEIKKAISDISTEKYYLSKQENHYYSVYPILPGLFSVPIYIVPILLNKIPEMTYHENLLKALLLARISASFYTALSVGVFYLITKEISDKKVWNVVFTIFYALGTSLWSVCSRGMWQHTISQLSIAISVFFALKSLKKEKFLIILSAVLGLAVLARPTNIFIALVFFVYILTQKRHLVLKFAATAIPFALLLLLYNYTFFGGIFSEGYGSRNDFAWSTSLSTSIPGYLFSPARSFLFISPPLILSYFAFFMFKIFDKEKKILYRYLGTGLVLSIFLFAKWYTWDGANAFGNRMFSDFLPIFGLFAYEVFLKLKINWKLIFTGLMIYSICLHYNAVFWRKSRCPKDQNWSFYCLKRPDAMPKY